MNLRIKSKRIKYTVQSLFFLDYVLIVMTVLVKYQHKTSNREAWFYAKPDSFKKPIIFIGLILASLMRRTEGKQGPILTLLFSPIVK